MDLSEIRPGLAYEISRLTAKQLLVDEPEDEDGGGFFFRTRAEMLLHMAHRHRQRAENTFHTVGGLPGRVVEVGVAHGRLKNGVKVEVEYSFSRARHLEKGIIHEQDPTTGEFIYDTRTFEAVVAPSQVVRTWDEKLLADAMHQLDKESGAEIKRHWYEDCPDRQPADVVWNRSGNEVDSPVYWPACDRCLHRSCEERKIDRSKRKLRPEQERVLRHVEVLLRDGAITSEEAEDIRNRQFIRMANVGPGPRGRRLAYVLGWLDGRGLE